MSLVTIILLAVFLRVINLDQSLWLDEAAQAWESARPLSQQFNINPDFHPPLYHVYLHFWMKLGQAEWTMRLTSVFSGLATVVISYLIGKTIANEKVGKLAALLLAIAPYHIYYSQELRMYAFSAFWASLLIYAILKRNWKLHILSLVGGLYTIYLFPFMVIVEFIYIAVTSPKMFKSWISSCFIAGLAFLPWLPSFYQQLSGGVDLPSIWPQWRNLSSVAAWKAFPLTYAKFILGRITFANKFVYAGLVTGASAFVLPGLLSGITQILPKRKLSEWSKPLTSVQSTQTLLILLWLSVPIFIAWLMSFWIPINGPWRLLLSLPALYLLLALGIESINHNFLKKTLLAGVISFSLLGTGLYHTQTQFHRENWRSAIAWLQSETEGNHSYVILHAFPEPFAPAIWYGRGTDLNQVGVLDGLKVDPETIDHLMTEVTTEKNTVYRFEYLQDLSDTQKHIPQWLEDHGYQLVTSRDFRGVGFIHQYRLVPQLALQ